jgi:hypothetical protein
MKNQLLEPVEYKVDRTRGGTWRSFLHVNGQLFQEYRSHRTVFGFPLVHYTRGRSPETGRRVVARGFFAFGRYAVGVVAFGQAALGIVAFGQAGIGLLAGFGQGATGFLALGQLAIGLALGIGQLATGYVAVGQLALGAYVLAQIGHGTHAWTQRIADPEAVRFFRSFLP